jgi:hypothetical protein
MTDYSGGWPRRPLLVRVWIPPSDQTAIQRQIDATDRQIDQLVYELYGLTDDEIRIVEEATR